MSSSRFQLEYAPAEPHRRWPLKKLLRIAAVVLLVWAGVQYGPMLARRGSVMLTQRRCATFDYAPDTVIYETDSPAAQKLLEDKDNYVLLNDTTIWPTRAVARREPPSWVEYKRLMFGQRTFWPPGPAAPKALVHRLRNRKGDQRIVAIIVAPAPPPQGLIPAGSAPSAPRIGLVAAVVIPADWSSDMQWRGNSLFLATGFENAKHVRVRAGRIDSRDEARFVIPYEMDGAAGEIEGRLEMNGEVILKVLSGPAKRELIMP